MAQHLKRLMAMADEEGHDLLAYLITMAEVEARYVADEHASGSTARQVEEARSCPTRGAAVAASAPLPTAQSSTSRALLRSLE